jgi:tetratricopeptide (TPR) repeat protein
MKGFAVTRFFIGSLFALFGLFFLPSCESKQKTETFKRQISSSPAVEKLLDDTASYNPLVDSLKTQIKILPDSDAILLLGELSENWRPHSYIFAQEELSQGKNTKLKYAEADAYCKFGILYYRKFNFDSANYFLDKAEQIANTNKWDKITAQAMSWRAEVFRQSGEKQKGLELQDKALQLATAIGDKRRMAFCLLSKGEALRGEAEWDKAFDCYLKCILYSAETNDQYKIMICYNSMGDVYRVRGELVKALENFQKGLSIAKKYKNTNQWSFSLNCLGDVYRDKKEWDKALDYYKEALAITQGTGNKLRVSNIFNSMASIYLYTSNLDLAYECYDRSIKISEEINQYDNIAVSNSGIGSVYAQQGNYVKALEHYTNAYDIATETENKGQICDFLYDIGELYMKKGDLAKARQYAERSLQMAKEIQLLSNIKTSALLLYKIQAQLQEFKDASKTLMFYVAMKDSLGSEEEVKKFAAAEYREKEADLIAQQEEKEKAFKLEQARKEEELKRQKTIRYAFTIGFGLVLILAIVIYRGLRVNKKQNKIITAQKKEVEHQKELVDEKNKEITDSITYAKRLQEAILPPVKMVKQFFPESFVLYKPKDIIAGDFYWMEKIDDTIFFAAADSTGHGVPGAMVSVVCSNALNRAVKEFGLKEPGRILDKTRELVIETFEKSEGEVKDGMDISLISLTYQGTNTISIKWSGANNPLWYISDGKLEEIKATKQPIGKSDNPQPFATHTINYVKGSVFYLLTDGYADQFGGPKGKKFKYKQLEDLILNHSNSSLEAQEKLLDAAFEEWRGGYDQVDDVTVIAVKIS